MDKLDKLIDKYADTFKENVPLFCLRGYTDDELIEMIQKAIDTHIPIEIDDDDDDILY